MNVEKMLLREEGFVPHAYQDHLGYWTIGIGRLIDKRRGGGISEEEALYLLRNDVRRIRERLDEEIPWWVDLNRPRQAVLIGMAYQMGVPGLLKFRNTLAAVANEDYATAAKGMRASLWARQTPGRAERMAKQMETGRFA
jgi:lysozyme